MILRASRATTAFIWATSSADRAKSGLSVEDLAGELLALAVGAALQLALHVLADHAPERLEAQVEVVADAREHARVEPLRLQQLHDPIEVALDRLPVELVVDPAGEVADLEEVHQPLEAGALALLADGHLHVAPLAAQEELGQLVHLHARLGHEPVEHLLHLRVLRTERLLEPFAEGLQVEEVEVEDAVEGGEVARLLDQGGGERALNVSRSSRPISVEAASASSASLGEMRISARRRSPMNSRILWSI